MRLRANHLSSRTLCTAVACLLALSLEQIAISQAAKQEQSSNSHEKCPTISVSCPSDSGDKHTLTFTALLDRVVPEPLRYEWTISAGTIVEGQGTPTINVDMSGTGGRTVTASVDVAGLMNLCKRRASCSMIPYEHFPVANLFDVYNPKPTGPTAPKKTRRRRKSTRLR